jgi:hypothetical protein
MVMRIAQGTAFGLVMALSAMAWAEEPSDVLGLPASGSVVSDRDLAGTSGLGVSVDNTSVTDSDGSLIILGAGNSAALADAKGNISGDVKADTVTAGEVHNLSVQNLRGFNVVQVNTAPNANQIVSQAVNVYIIDSGGALGP